MSVFIGIAIIADTIDVSRFKDSGRFTSYPLSAPRVANSNTTVKNRGTNKTGRKLSATLLTQSLEYHYGRDPRNHGMKMTRYRRFLEKQKKAV